MTSLAVHWAHLIAGRFPDGQLYLNLRGPLGLSGTPISVAEALRGFLEALGVPAQQMSAERGALIALYRTEMLVGAWSCWTTRATRNVGA